MQDIYDENGEIFDIKLTPHLIAIVDILKTKDMMNSEKSDCYLRSFYLFFTSIRNMILERNSNIVINTYSDNIVLAVDLDECRNISDEIHSFLKLVCAIQGNVMLRHKFMIRGAVTIGEAYISSELCYGKGFLNAYYLESYKAKYPRIIVDESITNFYENEELLKVDSDGQAYLDYLNFCKFNESVEKNGWYLGLVFHKDCFKQNYDDYLKMPSITENDIKQKDKVFEKLNWFKNYHNDYCRQIGVDTCFFIELEL